MHVCVGVCGLRDYWVDSTSLIQGQLTEPDLGLPASKEIMPRVMKCVCAFVCVCACVCVSTTMIERRREKAKNGKHYREREKERKYVVVKW